MKLFKGAANRSKTVRAIQITDLKKKLWYCRTYAVENKADQIMVNNHTVQLQTSKFDNLMNSHIKYTT